MLATNVGCLCPGLMLPQNPDDLLFREPARFHVHPPSEVMDSTQIRRSFRGSGQWVPRQAHRPELTLDLLASRRASGPLISPMYRRVTDVVFRRSRRYGGRIYPIFGGYTVERREYLCFIGRWNARS